MIELVKRITLVAGVGSGIAGMAMPYLFGSKSTETVTVARKADAVVNLNPTFHQLRFFQAFEVPLLPPAGGADYFAPLPMMREAAKFAAEMPSRQQELHPLRMPEQEQHTLDPQEPAQRRVQATRDICAADGGHRVDYGRYWRCVYPHRHKHRH